MTLDELRKQIDSVDEKLVELINERARIAAEIGKVKQANEDPVYVPHREKAVLDKISKLNKTIKSPVTNTRREIVICEALVIIGLFHK